MINSIKEDIDIELLKLKQNYHPEKAKAIFGQFQIIKIQFYTLKCKIVRNIRDDWKNTHRFYY